MQRPLSTLQHHTEKVHLMVVFEDSAGYWLVRPRLVEVEQQTVFTATMKIFIGCMAPTAFSNYS
jgi:hypothetical protein